MKQIMIVIVIAMAFGLLAPMQVAAQDFDRSWVVWKLSLNFKNGKDEIYKPNLTKHQAEELAEEKNKSNEEWTKYTYHAQQSKENETTGIRPGRIEMPRMGFIDVGPLGVGRSKDEAKKVPSLAGKTGKGTIGENTVKFQFKGKDSSGTVSITGDMAAEGKWEETGTGAVYIKTKGAVLRGGTDGEKASGLRFSEDKSQPLAGWSVVFDKTEKVSEEKSYHLEGRVLNGFSGSGPLYARFSAYSDLKGPYTLEEARAAMDQAEGKRAEVEASEGKKIQISIVDKSGRFVEEHPPH